MSLEQRYRVNSPNVVHETIEGEVVIIHLDTGCYYSLDGVGAAIWNRLDAGASLGETVAWLDQKYPDRQAVVETTVNQLAGELLAEDLILGVDGRAAEANGQAEIADPLPPVFAAPVLHKHTDMQDLLLLDPIHEVDETGWPSVKRDPGL